MNEPIQDNRGKWKTGLTSTRTNNQPDLHTMRLVRLMVYFGYFEGTPSASIASLQETKTLMTGSIERVTEAARQAGMEIEVKRVVASTRTSKKRAAMRLPQCRSDRQVVDIPGRSQRQALSFPAAGSSRLSLAKAEGLTGED